MSSHRLAVQQQQLLVVVGGALHYQFTTAAMCLVEGKEVEVKVVVFVMSCFTPELAWSSSVHPATP